MKCPECGEDFVEFGIEYCTRRDYENMSIQDLKKIIEDLDDIQSACFFESRRAKDQLKKLRSELLFDVV